MKNSRFYGVYSKGFSLIELMVALAIGLFLLAGVFTVYVNGVQSTRVVDDQTVMVDNVRFALEAISADTRQAGVFGRVLPKVDAGGVINIDNTTAAGSVAAECYAGWALNVTNPIMVSNDAAPFGGPCISNYLQGDTLEVRGTLRTPVAAAAQQANAFYINSDVNTAQFYYGAVSPNTSARFADYNYYNHFYYIASFSDNAADGIPSLHRVSLQPGGVVSDQVLLSGVSNMQIQLGLNTDNSEDGTVDSYADASAGLNWAQVRSVQVTLTVVSQDSNYTGTNTVGGRRQMTVTSVTELRDMNLAKNNL